MYTLAVKRDYNPLSLTSANATNAVGVGYLNVYNALSRNALPPSKLGAASSPTVAYNSASGQVYLVNGSSVVWCTCSLGYISNLWTNTSGQSFGESSVAWGTGADSGFSVIWGSNVMWGASNSDAMTIAINGEQ